MSRAETPRYLFHWTSADELRRLAARVEPGKPFPLGGAPRPASAFFRGYPQLRRRPSLFAWIHPVTGLAPHPRLVYGRGASRSSRLLVLKLRPGARVLRLRSVEPCRPRLLPAARVEGAELIYHEISYPNGSLVREWVIMKASAITAYAAPCRELRAFLLREAKRLREPARDYPERLHHSRSGPLFAGGRRFHATITSIPSLRRRIVIARIAVAGGLGSARVPMALRRGPRVPASALRAWAAV